VQRWFDYRTRPWMWLLLAFGSAALFGYLTCWVVCEYDVFWQIRAGSEILSGKGVQRVEHWSYTATGQPWFNYEWLSTVLDYIVFSLHRSYGALSWLRALLVGSWIFALVCLVRRGAGNNLAALLLALVLVPWLYVACSFRLQMRPDLFATVLYALLLSIWLADVNAVARRTLSLIVLLAWANFHCGTFPFGLVFFAAAVLFEPEPTCREPWVKRSLWVAAGALTWLATPIGYNVFAVLKAQAPVFSYEAARNPDVRPFGIELLEYRNGGWCLLLWVTYTALAIAAFVRVAPRKELLPGMYRHLGFVMSLGIAFTLSSLMFIRSIHYQMVFLLPVVAAGSRSLLVSRAGRDTSRWVASAAAIVVGILLWAVVLPDQVSTISKPIGTHVYDLEIPVQSVEFLKRAHPAGRLLNANQFGGYLINELPEYPVATDGRQTPFQRFFAEIQAVQAQPEAYAGFLRRYGINVVLELPPSMVFDPTHGFGDTHILLYPPEEWAQVFFDNASVVYLRRIPENQAIIEKYAYKTLRRGLPANFGAAFEGLTGKMRSMFESELDRCVAENPRCVYCLVGKSAFHRSRNDTKAALGLLRRALAINPSSADALIEISGVYLSLGLTNEAGEAKRRLQRVTTPLAP
jgi:hypothetical protein